MPIAGYSGLNSDREGVVRLSQSKARDPFPMAACVTQERARAINAHRSKWVNGTSLHYAFLDHPRAVWVNGQKDVVRRAFAIWKRVGIGLSFVEVTDTSAAEIRIGCDPSDGTWSWVGTDVLHNEDRGRTMNFAWDLTTPWGKATALREIGHLSGMEPAHLSSAAGIEWNEDKLYSFYSAPPNEWDPETVRWNFLRTQGRHEIERREWDPYSIMQCPIPPNHIRRPERWRGGIAPNLKLSDLDKAWARETYPAMISEKPIGVLDLQLLNHEQGAQTDFVFEPQASRTYAIKLLGPCDAKIVVFTRNEGQWRFHAAQDFSGCIENTEITVRLVADQRYALRTRVHYTAPFRSAAIVIV